METDAPAALVDQQVAGLALPRWGFSDHATLRMINLSENATFLVEEPAERRTAILRVHRVDYHDRTAIESELDWIEALQRAAVVATPAVIRTSDDERVVTTEVNGRERHAVLFELVPGIEPDDVALETSDFASLGALTARMHAHARSWTPPAGFTRFAWDWEHTLGDRPRWGRWQDGIGVGPDERELLGRAAELIRARLSAYGRGEDRYGLIHADLRLANLLVDGDHVTVIDFDDCGDCWFLYDFGTAVSFLEHDERLPQWQAAWLEGYRSEAPLSEEHEAMLATFVMLRRLLLVAWMGSHAHSRECQELGPDYTSSSLDLARRYLASGGTSLS
jgi:Ser/Thr protein kinase RdoA (MazF antagonist)